MLVRNAWETSCVRGEALDITVHEYEHLIQEEKDIDQSGMCTQLNDSCLKSSRNVQGM